MSHQESRDEARAIGSGLRPCLSGDDRLARDLRAAALDRNPAACGAVLTGALARGMVPARFRDVIIPAAAVELGARWCRDGLAFAEVSIGAARLQGLVRQLAEARSPGPPDWSAREILVVVPDGVQHTLGATILVAQLRDAGMAVRFLPGASGAELRDALRRSRPDGVFVSSIAAERLDHARPIVDEVRKFDPRVPVVIGGPDGMAPTDLCAVTGADHATKDIETALILCGLNQTPCHARPAVMMS